MPLAGGLGARRGGPNPRSGRSRFRSHPAEVLLPGHVSLPLGSGSSRGSSRGLHRHRHHLPSQTDAGLQRPSPDGIRRLRSAGRAVRSSDRRPSSGNDDFGDRELPSSAQTIRIRLRLVAGVRHDRPGLLSMDPVDLVEGLRLVVRSSIEPGPSDQRSGRGARFG